MNWKDKKVFVTGGTGFIGTHLCKKLVELGADLWIVWHKRVPFFPCNPVRSDLREYDERLFHWIKNVHPEVIFHLAAQPIVLPTISDEMETLKTNINGTYNILHIAKEVKPKSFVHISTDKVYGNVSPITRNTRLNGVGHPYNVSKLSGDVLAQMYSNFFDIPMTIVRNANVYGAGDIRFDRIVPRTILKMFNGEPPVVRGDGTNTRDYVHVSEIVDGYIRAAELPYNNKLTEINLSGFNHSVIDIIDTIAKHTGRVDLTPVFEEQWKGEIPHQTIVNDAARELIGWNPKIDIDEGIEMTVAWYKEYLYGKG